MNGAGPISLVDVARDLACIDQLDGAAVAAVVLELSGVQARLAARLAQLGAELRNGEHDKLLTLEQAASLLTVSPSWLKRRPHLPFVVKLSDGTVRYSEQGIWRWLQRKAGARP